MQPDETKDIEIDELVADYDNKQVADIGELLANAAPESTGEEFLRDALQIKPSKENESKSSVVEDDGTKNESSSTEGLSALKIIYDDNLGDDPTGSDVI